MDARVCTGRGDAWPSALAPRIIMLPVALVREPTCAAMIRHRRSTNLFSRMLATALAPATPIGARAQQPVTASAQPPVTASAQPPVTAGAQPPVAAGAPRPVARTVRTPTVPPAGPVTP